MSSFVTNALKRKVLVLNKFLTENVKDTKPVYNYYVGEIKDGIWKDHKFIDGIELTSKDQMNMNKIKKTKLKYKNKNHQP